MDVDHADKKYQAYPSGRLTLPPLADTNKEPEIIREPEVQKVPSIHTTPNRPPEPEPKAPEYTPPAPETTDVPEDDVFGKTTGGTWNFGQHGESGDSDFGSDAPWDEKKKMGLAKRSPRWSLCSRRCQTGPSMPSLLHGRTKTTHPSMDSCRWQRDPALLARSDKVHRARWRRTQHPRTVRQIHRSVTKPTALLSNTVTALRKRHSRHASKIGKWQRKANR